MDPEIMNTKKVVLFGRTGAGKSTIANMLCHGHPSPEGGAPVSDGFRGVTSRVSIIEGNGWIVTDTIGMGEPETGTVSNLQAEKRLCSFFRQIKSDFLYIVYVAKRERMQDAQAITWEAFKTIFKGGEKNFVVVFTNSSQAWLDENISHIKTEYEGCDKFIAVDFPPTDQDPAQEDINRTKRGRSLSHLTVTLEGYGLTKVYPAISRMTEAELWQHAKLTISYLMEYAVQKFIRGTDNPFGWVVKKITGMFFTD